MAEIKSKEEEFREKSIDELLSSEERYLHHLNLLKEYFINPILTDQLLPQNIFSGVFGNIASIEAVNVRLLEELRRNIAKDTIGQPFLKLSPYLKIYGTYAKIYEEAQSSLKEYEDKNKYFKRFKENQECRPELNGLKLNSLLITPIQRIPRYRLLLHEIISHTPSDHHDFKKLVDAEKAVGDVAEHINMHVSQTSDFQVLLKVQRALTNNQPSIIAPGRILIKHGTVRKLSRRGNGEQLRVLFLFTDIMMYCKPKDSNYLKQGSIECCCILPLSHCSVTPIFGITFKVSCKDEEIKFYAESPYDCNLWIENIQNAIGKNCADKATLKKVVSSKILLTRKMLAKHKAASISVIMRRQAFKRTGKCDIENNSLCSNSSFRVAKNKVKLLQSMIIDNNENVIKNEIEKKPSPRKHVISDQSSQEDCNKDEYADEDDDETSSTRDGENFHSCDGKTHMSGIGKYNMLKNNVFGKNADVFACTII